MKKLLILLLFICALSSCKKDEKKNVLPTAIEKPTPTHRYGYKLDDFKVIQDTIEKGESFGIILDRHHVYYPKIIKIAGNIKDVFDVRRVRAGKP